MLSVSIFALRLHAPTDTRHRGPARAAAVFASGGRSALLTPAPTPAPTLDVEVVRSNFTQQADCAQARQQYFADHMRDMETVRTRTRTRTRMRRSRARGATRFGSGFAGWRTNENNFPGPPARPRACDHRTTRRRPGRAR